MDFCCSQGYKIQLEHQQNYLSERQSTKHISQKDYSPSFSRMHIASKVLIASIQVNYSTECSQNYREGSNQLLRKFYQILISIRNTTKEGLFFLFLKMFPWSNSRAGHKYNISGLQTSSFLHWWSDKGSITATIKYIYSEGGSPAFLQSPQKPCLDTHLPATWNSGNFYSLRRLPPTLP